MQAQAGARRAGMAHSYGALAAMLAAVLVTAGCQGMAMTERTTAARNPSRPDNTVADWPLKFVQHNFGGFCYSTYGCTIQYGGYSRTEPDDHLAISSESLAGKYPGNLRAGYLGIRGFPGPARVSWRSKDGVSHEATIDIAAIFKDRLILHNVPREEIREGVSITNPGIILEVNDRTINVYMRAFIPTKELQEPGNRHSGHRDEPVLAWSRTY
ncbi:hypothetical protein QF205_02270 [Luteimonas composti]|uniref:DUF3304 domain-containing protein n=1 Tax=Luteimonas composti TaxID=398257 RepID=A0ABT6MMU0_9GAMM|nr:hypothetical protein [Luteimonas composti]MDH7451905.1 hypothetical protein [Luteimonas composti]